VSILAIQRKHSELFRIRLGKRNGTTPSRLINEIRVTSPNRKVVDAFAEVYGGRPKRWPDGPGGGQHEVYLPTSRLPITFIGGQTLQQHMELWKGSTCARRCDSVTMSDGSPCACGPDLPIAERECKPVSRLTVACPDVPIAGVGLLTTRSEIAAAEFDGVISLIRPTLEAGRSVNAILRVDQMSGVNRQYAVPRIELEGVSFQDLALAASSQPALGPAPAEPLAIGGGES
jgi:hypothetical protein